MSTPPLRLCEYECRTVDWSASTRAAVTTAAIAWQLEHRLPKPPLSFEGPAGNQLRAQQYVGLVEAGGVRIEIYPKLDIGLLAGVDLTEPRAATVMGNLLWLLERSGFDGLVDAGDASVADGPASLSDLLAWLFARRLGHQLSIGLPHEYHDHADDLSTVRGSIQFSRQATVHFSRPDVIACRWDELTADTPLSRLLKGATTTLLHLTRLPGAATALRHAHSCLESAGHAPPARLLHEASQIRWSRLNARWRPCHDLAVAILRGTGREIHAGQQESFVFLLDMNQLFESYAATWLERKFQRPIQQQKFIGKLLIQGPHLFSQIPDFFWSDDAHRLWVGDAKYKMAKDAAWPKIDDIRQLICYGQLAARTYQTSQTSLMLLYPTTGEENQETLLTYDSQTLILQSVRLLKPVPTLFPPLLA